MRYEAIHAVTYFAPHSAQAAREAGLKGFWMGYFGFRAAPMGEVSAGVVKATFANFAPSRVERAVPDAWALASPESLLAARSASAAAALRELDETVADTARSANPLLERLVAAGDGLGRPLFAANLALPLPEDPVERLWQLCTTLREYRGDGHVIALAAEEVTGPEAHLLLLAERNLSEEMLLLARGFNESEWTDAKENLQAKGLVEKGHLTEVGISLRNRIEATTDRLADGPFDVLSSAELSTLTEHLERSARAVMASGFIPENNPIGLPVLD